MAFHPFHFVRKHQKVLLALATIFCMGVFILQFGRGDISSLLTGRGSQGTGDKVATLYGRDVTGADLVALRQSRQVANALVESAFQAAEKQALDNVQAYKPDSADAEPGKTLGELCASVFQREPDFPFLRANPQLIKIFAQSPEFQSIPRDYARLSDLERSIDPAKAKDVQKVIADLRFLLRYQFFTLTQAVSPLYFGGGVNNEDLLDFEIWKHQAEKNLSVVLTKADARRALADLAGGHDLPADPGGSWRDDPVFKPFFEAHPQVTENQAATALENEFCVRIAQNLMGVAAPGVPALDDVNRASPDPVSPYDFWKYYRDNRTSENVAFLQIPVEPFVGELTKDIDSGKRPGPTEQELSDLFNEYADKVPNPALPTPGFMEPRRMKVEYVSVKADADYYKNLAQNVQFDPQRFTFSAALGANLAGGGVGPAATLAYWLTTYPVTAQYDQEIGNYYGTAFADQSLLGMGAGGDLTAFSAPAALLLASAQEQDARARQLAADAFRSSFNGAVTGTPFVADLETATTPAPFSADEAARRLTEKWRTDTLLPEIVKDDLARFGRSLQDEMKHAREETEKKNAENKNTELDPEKAANDRAEEYIRKTAQERGWELNEKAGLDDRYQIDTDEALRPLRETWSLFAFINNQQPGQEKAPPTLTDLLFTAMPAGQYQPYEQAISTDNKTFLYLWRSEDLTERKLSYDEARPRVLAAWKFQEARKLALLKAQEVGGESEKQALTEVDGFLRDQKVGDRLLGSYFELAGVARLIPGPTPNPGLSSTYGKYQIPADKIPNAPDGLLDRLLALEQPGQWLVFKDKPATHFYVAVVKVRDVPTFSGKDRDANPFTSAYSDAADPQKADLWLRFFLPDRERAFQRRLMRQLREEAAGPAGVNEQGQLILTGGKQTPQPTAPEGGEEPQDPLSGV